MNEITVKLLKIMKHTFTNTSYSKAISFGSPCNINNFDGIENGGDSIHIRWYQSFTKNAFTWLAESIFRK